MLIIITALVTATPPEFKGDLNVNVKTGDMDNDAVIYKPVRAPIYNTEINTEINKAYEESRLEISCDIILNKVESTKDNVKHIWEERAKRLQC